MDTFWEYEINMPVCLVERILWSDSNAASWLY